MLDRTITIAFLVRISHWYSAAHLIDPPDHGLPLEQLPGVGHESDGVADHDDDADVDPDPGHQHVLSANVTLVKISSSVWLSRFYILLLPARIVRAAGIIFEINNKIVHYVSRNIRTRYLDLNLILFDQSLLIKETAKSKKQGLNYSDNVGLLCKVTLVQSVPVQYIMLKRFLFILITCFKLLCRPVAILVVSVLRMKFSTFFMCS